MDKLRALTFFARAVETGSFAAAAQTLDVVPSALSKAIAALEREVGVALFHRSTRKLSLTPEGEAYHTRCRQALLALEEAEAVARGNRGHVQGALRIGLHPALRAVILPELGRLLALYPRLRVETFITNSPSALLDRGLDVVLCIGPLGDSTVVARRLGWVEFAVCASPAYLELCGEPTRPQELAAHRAIIFARPDEEPNTQWQFARGRERQVVSVRAAIVVRDGVGLVDAGAGGGGVLRPYRCAARDHLERGTLRALLPGWSGPRHPVSAALPSRHYVPARVRAFMDFARELRWD